MNEKYRVSPERLAEIAAIPDDSIDLSEAGEVGEEWFARARKRIPVVDITLTAEAFDRNFGPLIATGQLAAQGDTVVVAGATINGFEGVTAVIHRAQPTQTVEITLQVLPSPSRVRYAILRNKTVEEVRQFHVANPDVLIFAAVTTEDLPPAQRIDMAAANNVGPVWWGHVGDPEVMLAIGVTDPEQAIARIVQHTIGQDFPAAELVEP